VVSLNGGQLKSNWDIEARFKRFGTAPYRTHVEVLKWMRSDDPPCFLIENSRSEAEKGSTFSFVRTHPL
jgi:hypothetical protein